MSLPLMFADLESMDVYVDGEKEESFVSPSFTLYPGITITSSPSSPQGEFADMGSDTHFSLAGRPALIRSRSSGDRRRGMLHSLVLGDRELEPLKIITN